MAEPEPLISLGLNQGAARPVLVPPVPSTESLQFRRAEYGPDPAAGPRCLACKQATGSEYFQVNGSAVCPRCASAIESRQKGVSNRLLLKAFLYGSGAALAGCVLYSGVAIATGMELALIAILIGYMVGTAIHKASGGGRPQQIMAIVLTYLAISTSFVPVAIYRVSKRSAATTTTSIQPPAATSSASSSPSNGAFNHASSSPVEKPSPLRRRTPSLISIVGALLWIAVAAPFLTLHSAGGFLSLVIMFFGLQRAWRLTAQPDMIVSGPYSAVASA